LRLNVVTENAVQRLEGGVSLRIEFIALAAAVIFFAAFIAVNMSGYHDWGGADRKAEGVVSDITGGSYHRGSGRSGSRRQGR